MMEDGRTLLLTFTRGDLRERFGWWPVASGKFDQAIQELTLPLRHEDIIRQQSAKKNLDPALVAAVIYQESKFADQTSSAGARGLM